MADPEHKWGLTAALLRPDDDEATTPYEPVDYEAPSARLKPPSLPPLPPKPSLPDVDVPRRPDTTTAPSDLIETSRIERPRTVVGPSSTAPELPRFATWQVATACAAALVIGMMIGNSTRGTANRSGKAKDASVIAAGPRRAAATTTSVAAVTAVAPTTVTTSTPATTAPGNTGTAGPPGVLLYIQRHVGAMTTPHFTPTGPRWSLGWAYDCSQQGGTGAFKVTVRNADGTPTQDAGVTEQGASGKAVSTYTTTGDRYLVVETPCAWAIRVTA